MAAHPSRPLLLATLWFCALPSAYLAAQQQGGQSSGGSSTPGTVSRPPSTQGRRPGDRERRVIFISGQVVMEDGTPPPERATIERVCGGSSRSEGYADSKGYFAIQLGSNVTGVMQDASSSSMGMGGLGMTSDSSPMGSMDPNPGVSEADLMSCELRASLPGYRSTTIPLAGRRLLDPSGVGTLVLYSMGAVRGSTISATSMRAPKDAKKAYKKGHDLLGKKKFDEAQAQLEKALAEYPKYADAWYDLGLVHESQQRVEEARKSYNQALESDSRFVLAYLPLAQYALKENDWNKALDLTDKALTLNPFEYPAIHFYNAVANFNLQKLDAAERSARKAELLDSAHNISRSYLLLSRILTAKNDYRGAAEQIRGYLKIEPDAPDQAAIKEELGRLESRANSKPTAPAAADSLRTSPRQAEPAAQQ